MKLKKAFFSLRVETFPALTCLFKYISIKLIFNVNEREEMMCWTGAECVIKS